MPSTIDGYPNEKVNAAVYTGPTAEFTKNDWIELALAALDQAGVHGPDYKRVEAIVEQWKDETEAA